MRKITSIDEFSALARATGGLMPVSYAALAAGISRQRMAELVKAERVPGWEFAGHVYVGFEGWKRWLIRKTGQDCAGVVKRQLAGVRESALN